MEFIFKMHNGGVGLVTVWFDDAAKNAETKARRMMLAATFVGMDGKQTISFLFVFHCVPCFMLVCVRVHPPVHADSGNIMNFLFLCVLDRDSPPFVSFQIIYFC